MNKDQIKGRAESAKGKTKEVVGKATGSKKMETEGKLDQASGKARSTYGDIKSDIKGATK